MPRVLSSGGRSVPEYGSPSKFAFPAAARWFHVAEFHLKRARSRRRATCPPKQRGEREAGAMATARRAPTRVSPLTGFPGHPFEHFPTASPSFRSGQALWATLCRPFGAASNKARRDSKQVLGEFRARFDRGIQRKREACTLNSLERKKPHPSQEP